MFFRNAKFFQTAEEFMTSDEPGVAFIANTKVVSIDHYDKILDLDDGRSILYNKCLIATGVCVCVCLSLPVPGNDW